MGQKPCYTVSVAGAGNFEDAPPAPRARGDSHAGDGVGVLDIRGFFPPTARPGARAQARIWKEAAKVSGSNRGGRPPKYTDPGEMQRIIDAYFKSCEGEVLRDGNDEPVLNKFGEAVMVGQRPPTMTGLALALGFADRSSLMDYKGKRAFAHVIRRAKSRLEQYAEERLYDRDGQRGAQFSLQNNFKGWKDVKDVSVATTESADIMAEVRARMAGALKTPPDAPGGGDAE